MSRDVDDVGFARALVQEVQEGGVCRRQAGLCHGVANGGGWPTTWPATPRMFLPRSLPARSTFWRRRSSPPAVTAPVTEISFRGTADLLVPYEGGASAGRRTARTSPSSEPWEPSRRWAELNWCTGSPSAAGSDGCSTYSSCASGAEVTLCTAQGGGMTWGALDRVGHAEAAFASLRTEAATDSDAGRPPRAGAHHQPMSWMTMLHH